MTDSAAIRFLENEIAPLLAAPPRSTLGRALRDTIRSGRLTPIETLPPRNRQEILDRIEERVEARPRDADLAAVVRLTTVVAGIHRSGPALRRLASPAR